MKSESVLVTGARGFIGRNLLREVEKFNPIKLCALDDEIFNVNDWPQKFLEELELINPTVIFHIGACSDTLENNVNYMFERNYLASQIILNWGQVNGAKVIYSSSAANYGTSGAFPSNLYGWSKFVTENYASVVGAVSLRYFNVYGPGEESKGRMASMFFQAHMNSIKNSPIKLFPGNPIRDFVYIRDVTSANLFAYENFDFIRGGVFEVASGYSETFEYGMDLMGFDYVYSDKSDIPLGYQFNTRSNLQKIMPGWVPQYDLEAGLKEYQDYLKGVLGE